MKRRKMKSAVSPQFIYILGPGETGEAIWASMQGIAPELQDPLNQVFANAQFENNQVLLSFDPSLLTQVQVELINYHFLGTISPMEQQAA